MRLPYPSSLRLSVTPGRITEQLGFGGGWSGVSRLVVTTTILNKNVPPDGIPRSAYRSITPMWGGCQASKHLNPTACVLFRTFSRCPSNSCLNSTLHHSHKTGQYIPFSNLQASCDSGISMSTSFDPRKGQRPLCSPFSWSSRSSSNTIWRP